MKIAVIGSGIAGLSCAYRLQETHDVTLFEANDYLGGHTHTVDVTLEGKQWGVDTGFLVFNHQTYPNLVKLFDELGVVTAKSDMSFAVCQRDLDLEWSGTSLDTLFAQRSNLFKPDFLRMVADIARFNKQTTVLARAQVDGAADIEESEPSLGQFLDQHGYSSSFRDWYLLPMAAAIWSCPTEQMLAFPLATFIRFCHNHGLLQVTNRPQWYTVQGGARHYVNKIAARLKDIRLNCPVRRVNQLGNALQVHSAQGCEQFDQVVFASHSDQTLAMLDQPSAAEQAILGAVKYQLNHAVLHTDSTLLPQRRKVWSAWNYESLKNTDRQRISQAQVCVHYLLNQLQPLPFTTPLIVSLNPVMEPAREHVLQRFEYAHPVFDGAAIAAQGRLPEIQGVRGIWYCGAWTGYGFHEDGLKSGLAVARMIKALSVQQSHQQLFERVA